MFTSRLLIEDETLDFSAIEIDNSFLYYYLFGYEILATNHFCLSVTLLICPVVTSKCDSREIQNKCSFYPKIYSKQLHLIMETENCSYLGKNDERSEVAIKKKL